MKRTRPSLFSLELWAWTHRSAPGGCLSGEPLDELGKSVESVWQKLVCTFIIMYRFDKGTETMVAFSQSNAFRLKSIYVHK